MPWLDVLQDAFTFERAAVTPYTFAAVFVPTMVSYYAMAVLVQLPQTTLYRAALLPVVFWTAFRTTTALDFSRNHPGYIHLNHGLALGMFMTAMRCTAWVLVQRPYTRLSICKTGTSAVNDTATENGASISSAMWNACDLVMNQRLIGWNEPHKKCIPPPYIRVQSRFLFASISVCRSILFALALDPTCKYIRSFGPDTFGTSKGGTIFDPALPPLERYTKSSVVSFLSVAAIYFIVQATYQLLAALFTVLLRQYPSQWPPIFDSPWLSTSLTSFWGRRWHQLLREPVVAISGTLLGRFFGRVGIVMGAFTLSGILHDIGSWGMDQDRDTTAVAGFFVIHGVGVVLEHAWRLGTGKRVCGIIGWFWTTFWFLLWGPLLIDGWAKTGLLGSEFWPEAYSPTTLVLNAMSWKNWSA